MKKIFYVLSFILIVASCNTEEKIIEGEEKMGPPAMVPVCHYDAVTDTWSTINIPEVAKAAHLAHGDFDGHCDDRLTYVPDDYFEYLLILSGLDDVMDDYVLTSNISDVEDLGFFQYSLYYTPPGEIFGGDLILEDLTGIEDFTSLKSLRGEFPQISELDLSNNLLIEELYLEGSNTDILELDFSENLMLKEINIQGFRSFKSLNLSNNNSLEKIIVWGAESLESILIPDSPSVKDVIIEECDLLEELSFKTQSYDTVNEFSVVDCPNLICVEVYNPAYSTLSPVWNIPAHTSFANDCGY